MSLVKYFAFVSVTTLALSANHAEARCPGNVTSIRPRVVGRSLMTLPVMLDGNGPYDFVVDTGAQITTIDVQLAAQLHPKALGPTHVVGVGAYSRAAYAQLQLLQAGTYSMKEPLVLVQDLTQMEQIDHRIRGILGENFLAHYDLLIDYGHQILCLDDAKQMQRRITGERVALASVPGEGKYLPFTLPLVIATHVSGMSDWLLLQLDSGIDVPVLFERGKQLTHTRFFNSPLRHSDADEVTSSFAVLPPQDMRVGGHDFRQIAFVTPVTGGKSAEQPTVDGVLPTALFRSVFVSYADHFAVLEPR